MTDPVPCGSTGPVFGAEMCGVVIYTFCASCVNKGRVPRALATTGAPRLGSAPVWGGSRRSDPLCPHRHVLRRPCQKGRSSRGIGGDPYPPACASFYAVN